MSYTPCSTCGYPLEGYAGSPCTNPACTSHPSAHRLALIAICKTLTPGRMARARDAARYGFNAQRGPSE